VLQVLVIGFVSAAPEGWLFSDSIPDQRPLTATVTGDAELVWSQRIDLQPVVGMESIGDLFVAYSPYEFVAVSAVDGSQQWRMPTSSRLFTYDTDDHL
jgi:hypothetical protein